MKTIFALFAAAILASLGIAPASAANSGIQDQQRSDQGEARKEMRAGNILRSGEIERRVLPRMRGYEYLGFAYDAPARAYRLKFIKDGRVVNVDVDARTGRIISRSR